MRFIPIVIGLALCACNKESSPEGRMQIRTEHLQAGLDSLKLQNKAILDSIIIIRQELKVLRTESD